MTLVVGAHSHKTGVVCLAADSKVTWTNDEAKTRQIYIEPTLKVILLGDDVAVGLAGSGPDALARHIEGLRGEPIEQILDSLSKVDEAAFVVVQRSPTRLWMVSADGGIEDRTDIGRAWAGDVSPFNAFQQRFDDFADADVAFRLQSSMQGVTNLAGIAPVGGHVVMAVAGSEQPFRYRALDSVLMPAIFQPGQITGVTTNPDGTVNFALHLHAESAPAILRVLPGAQSTPGALGFYVENAGLGHLYPHGASFSRLEVRADTPEDFAAAATSDHGQHLRVNPSALGLPGL